MYLSIVIIYSYNHSVSKWYNINLDILFSLIHITYEFVFEISKF